MTAMDVVARNGEGLLTRNNARANRKISPTNEKNVLAALNRVVPGGKTLPARLQVDGASRSSHLVSRTPVACGKECVRFYFVHYHLMTIEMRAPHFLLTSLLTAFVFTTSAQAE